MTGTKSDVPNKLIELCVVLIKAHHDKTGLQLAIGLLGNPFDILVSYSTEGVLCLSWTRMASCLVTIRLEVMWFLFACVGYLSSNSAEFLSALLELLAVGVETGMTPMQTMTSLLPNLFGPCK